ncbi:MAG: hypothetical protein AMQ22_00932 [Candidatus Methanofastidiosum methylothiophilum]|uniref:Portal protein n=1 Tax=Candidatus Methanofastidiosum methylothiophilum TaxID=1705564 RepID=A0A150J516_9EURY|nr:MAG: hypothetical protein AMQ22_00932 [Candidatus Methanofastidiosum methylthiophilus]
MAKVDIENQSITKVEDKKLSKEIDKALEEVLPNYEEVQKAKQLYLNNDPMAQVVKDRFKESEDQRKEIEQRWLKDLRQYRGQYDPDVLSRIHPNRSKAYIRITRTKVKTVDSRLVDLLFPANGDRNWSITPTPVPSLTSDQMLLIQQQLQQSGVQQITQDMFDLAVKQVAEDKAKKMGTVIHDELEEMGYRSQLRSVIHSGNLYGTGILKGPMITLTKGKQYQQITDESGTQTWKMITEDKLLPYIEAVPVWDFYPDMSASNIRDARYCIQRHKMTKKQLLDLAKRSDFLGDKIKKYIEDHLEGDWEDKFHNTQLREIGDRSYSPNFNTKTGGRKYEVLEYWGYIDAKELEEMGATIPDNYKGDIEVAANVWVIGNYVIKAAVSHLNEVQWPFYLYYYDKDETSIFGEGIPSILRDVQELINSAFRAMLDNAAISAGPQFEVNLDLLSEDEDPTDIHPFKVWLRTGEGLDASQEAVKVKQVPSHTAEFLSMCQAFESYADEVTTIPKYMWGEATPGIARTSSGLSMLMGSANITIKDQVKNFDDGITSPFISAMYHWNMKFNDDDSIKGDYNIRAEGMSSLIAKEVYSQSLMQFAQITNNPVDLPMVKRSTILRKIAEALELGDQNLVMTEQEITANQQKQAQQQQQERDFMLKVTEVARQYGISPTDMVEQMRMAFADRQQMLGQAGV